MTYFYDLIYFLSRAHCTLRAIQSEPLNLIGSKSYPFLKVCCRKHQKLKLNYIINLIESCGSAAESTRPTESDISLH